MHKQRFYVVLDLEVSDKAQATRQDVAEALRDIVNIPQTTKDKETYWVELATVFEALPELQTAIEKELL